MDVIQGTHTGQLNPAQSAENSNTVGSAFALLNPTMRQLKAASIESPVPVEIPPPAEIPRPWCPAAVQPLLQGEFYSGADIMAALSPESVHQHADKPIPSWRTALICGVVTVNNEVWQPKKPNQAPPGITNGMGMFMSAQWAMLFNSSSFARRKHRWAVVTTRGGVLVLTGISLQDRPINPSDFPPCVQGGLTFGAADQMAIGENTPRCEFARVPKLWTVALRRADSVDVEGGDE